MLLLICLVSSVEVFLTEVIPHHERTCKYVDIHLASVFKMCWVLIVVTARNSSCGKVMFSQACVKNSVGGGHMWDTPPWTCMPPPRHAHPRACMPPVDTTRSGQWAGGTHHTGMHSCYHLQWSWGKVMFLHVWLSFCSQGGVCLSACWDTTHPPQEQTPSSPPPPGSRHPTGAVHAGRYGQQAGGTHPTGMHSCLKIVSFYLCTSCFFLCPNIQTSLCNIPKLYSLVLQ